MYSQYVLRNIPYILGHMTGIACVASVSLDRRDGFLLPRRAASAATSSCSSTQPRFARVRPTLPVSMQPQRLLIPALDGCQIRRELILSGRFLSRKHLLRARPAGG